MSNLDAYKKDIFEKETSIAEELVQQYFEINERKKQDEKWLKDNGTAIKDAMVKLGNDKKDFGQYRVAVSIPDTSKFDEDKVIDCLAEILTDEDFEKVTTFKLNEEVFEQFVNEGKINLDSIKLHAWVESKGAPRLTITKVKK